MKSPAFLFYSSDFLIGVSDLTNEEIGIYIKLMCLQHQKGHLTERNIGLFLGFSWVSISDELKSKFEIDENGCIFNRRLDEEIDKHNKFADKQANNGKKGGRPCKENNPNETQTKPNENPNNNPKKSPRVENENINVIEDEINVLGGVGEKSKIEKQKTEFENFRKKYTGKKRGLETEFENFRKKTPNYKNVLPSLLPALEKLFAWRAEMQALNQFVPQMPDLQTWINQRRWEEEFPEITQEKLQNSKQNGNSIFCGIEA